MLSVRHCSIFRAQKIYLNEERSPGVELCELLRGVELVLDADLSVRHGGDDGPPRVLDEGGSDGRLVWRHRGECHCRASLSEL